MGMQGCGGVQGAPVARSNSLQDPQEPKFFWLQNLKKHRQKGRVKVQTRNFMGLGEGKRAIESAGGLGGIGASGHTWQQTRVKKNVTFFGPNCRVRKKEPKIVLFTRLCRNKKQRVVRIEWVCRGAGGFMGHLMHVETAFKTHRNLNFFGCKA